MTNFEKPRDQQPPPASVGPGAADSAAPRPEGPSAPGGVAAGGPPSGPAATSPAEEHNSTASAPQRPAPAGFDERGRVQRGRISTLWISLIAAAIFLILLITFIAQNQAKASIHFLGFAGHMATGLVVLIAAIVGILLAAIPGTIRILQLRRSLKRNTPKEERTP